MRAIFIRHGESTANTGLASADVASIALTQRGEGEASRIARDWSEVPSLIVTSPFQRTKQTAAPTIARFPGVPVETWPIEEFTYLQPARWNGTASADRRPHVERYWTAADPAYCDGEGAESFGGFLRRVEATLARLAALPSTSLVYVFGHGQFIQAARTVVTGPDLDDTAQMRAFWRDGAPPLVANAQRVGFHRKEGRWECAATLEGPVAHILRH
ncbi:MAG: histidine phosphatase family protein [Blastomonas fulva]|uniref:histidine phosphatase family protein n=1 Tax=Blastomonas fulva TaxID=1550728 RepID=UPI0024E25052|nr:histidine phosphatase family protein [Blastomonas fulva]MDK2759181.1 histidine phosphatase family protein [Blastomonas fulva]